MCWPPVACRRGLSGRASAPTCLRLGSSRRCCRRRCRSSSTPMRSRSSRAEPSLMAGRTAPTVLTPHAGELTRLLGLEPDARADVEARRLEHARAAANALGATVLLKGSTTVVCSPDGLVRVNSTGTSWLATAGSGDVLSGVAVRCSRVECRPSTPRRALPTCTEPPAASQHRMRRSSPTTSSPAFQP